MRIVSLMCALLVASCHGRDHHGRHHVKKTVQEPEVEQVQSTDLVAPMQMDVEPMEVQEDVPPMMANSVYVPLHEVESQNPVEAPSAEQKEEEARSEIALSKAAAIAERLQRLREIIANIDSSSMVLPPPPPSPGFLTPFASPYGSPFDSPFSLPSFKTLFSMPTLKFGACCHLRGTVLSPVDNGFTSFSISLVSPPEDAMEDLSVPSEEGSVSIVPMEPLAEGPVHEESEPLEAVEASPVEALMVAPSVEGECEDDIAAFCVDAKEKKGTKGLFHCLHKVKKSLSTSCLAFLEEHKKEKARAKELSFKEDAASTSLETKADASSLPTHSIDEKVLITFIVCGALIVIVIATYIVFGPKPRRDEESYRLMMVDS